MKQSGALVLSSATTVAEAIWLEEQGCDMVIAQGLEAGGHRGMFLRDDTTGQGATLELLTSIREAVSVPIMAAGGIADINDMRACFERGAAAVQLGTAYMFCPEANVSVLYRDTLASALPTTLTNVFSGRLARGITNRFIEEVGPVSVDAPDFPHAAHFVGPLRRASEQAGHSDFMQLWAGEKRQPHNMTAAELTRSLGTHIAASVSSPTGT